MFVEISSTNISESLLLMITPKQIECIQRLWAITGIHPGKILGSG